MSELSQQAVLDDLVVAHLSRNLNTVDEAAVTGRFERFSAPYERVEIAPAPRTYVKTVRHAKPYEPAWFDHSDQQLSRIEDPEPTEHRQSWWWLVISLATAGVSVAVILCN
jgi:hypothetical protein